MARKSWWSCEEVVQTGFGRQALDWIRERTSDLKPAICTVHAQLYRFGSFWFGCLVVGLQDSKLVEYAMRNNESDT